jgi:hypothetical protein
VKNKRLVVAASFALLLVSAVPNARADGSDQPWDGPNHAVLDFAACLVQTAWSVASSAL